jgi:hypothetical protein
MNNVVTLTVFVAKVLCLIVFVCVLKPDGSIGAVWTGANPADCAKASGNAGKWAGVLSSGLASRRQSLHCLSERRSLLNNNSRMPQSS